jgi:ligand-binding SRPBCC domain-containing protein
MSSHSLTTWQWLPRPREEVFRFFSDARNLQRITPAFIHFEVVTPGTIEMRAGALIQYRLRLRGVPLRWTTRITTWEPPFRFIDIQLRGPYAEWVHTHTFEEEHGGTLVRDSVRYRLWGPGLMTRIINRVLVAPDTKRIFEFRQRRSKRSSTCGGARVQERSSLAAFDFCPLTFDLGKAKLCQR